MACPITWPLFEYWCSLCRHIGAPPCVVVSDIVCVGKSPRLANFSNQPGRQKKMSSLLKPFSVCEGPCESCGVRRGCASSPAHQQPPLQRLSAAAGLGSLPAHQRSYAARRNLAAAAVGGRKMTHPGKAILAGWFSFFFLQRKYWSRRFPSIIAAHCFLHSTSLISVCRTLKPPMQNWVKTHPAVSDGVAPAWCSGMSLKYLCVTRLGNCSFVDSSTVKYL